MVTAELSGPGQATVRSTIARELLPAWVRVYSFLWVVTLGSCLVVLVVPGGPPFARSLLPLTLTAAHNPPPTVAGALSIAANNTLRGVWPIALGLIDVQQRRVTRLLADGAVLANLLVPAFLVAGAICGYGPQALSYLPHAPVELAGIAVGAATWIVDQKHPISYPWRCSTVSFAVAILICSAVIEAFLTPHQ